jgi:hypothetical protein
VPSRWLLSNRTRALFLYSSWVVVCVGMFMLFMLSPWFQQVQVAPHGKLALQILGGALGVLGAPAGLIIWFGMVMFCVREDRASSKLFWFVLFFATAWFGAAIYFFVVYRKQFEQASSCLSSAA